MPAKIWTKEKVIEEALKYTKRQDFKKNSKSAYGRASKDGYLEEVCRHMEYQNWTKQKLLQVAKKYHSLSEFRAKENGAYLYSLKSGLKDEATSHMRRSIKPSGYWTKKQVFEEAKKYMFRGEFGESSASAYNKALSEGWLDDVCSHMKSEADGYNHSVYSIINNRLNMAYVGITRQQFNRRIKEHKKTKNTARSKKIANLKDTQFFHLTDYIFQSDEVFEAEKKWVEFYSNKGYEILNDIKQLGKVGTSRRKYSDEEIKKEALKYNRRVDFKFGSPKYYDAACSQRILKDVCIHMRGIKKSNYWNKEKILEFANKCSDRTEFSQVNNGAYAAAKRLGCLDEAYSLLRARSDMSWLRVKGERIKVWLNADYYYQTWLDNDKCGSWRMETLTKVKIDKMIKKFKRGWIPNEDSDWIEWKKSIQQNKKE